MCNAAGFTIGRRVQPEHYLVRHSVSSFHSFPSSTCRFLSLDVRFIPHSSSIVSVRNSFVHSHATSRHELDGAIHSFIRALHRAEQRRVGRCRGAHQGAAQQPVEVALIAGLAPTIGDPFCAALAWSSWASCSSCCPLALAPATISSQRWRRVSAKCLSCPAMSRRWCSRRHQHRCRWRECWTPWVSCRVGWAASSAPTVDAFALLHRAVACGGERPLHLPQSPVARTQAMRANFRDLASHGRSSSERVPLCLGPRRVAYV